MTIIATSNRAPDKLYEDGLNRYLYIPPFLKVLERSLAVVEVEGRDWRLEGLRRERGTAVSLGAADVTAAGQMAPGAGRGDAGFPVETPKFSEDFRAPSDGLPQSFFGKADAARAQEVLQKANLAETDFPDMVCLSIGYGRSLHAAANKSAARFTFAELFSGPPFYGPDDYNAIAARFDTIVLDGLPRLDMEQHNEVRLYLEVWEDTRYVWSLFWLPD